MYLFYLYRRLVGAQIRSQLQYRTSFVMDLMATGLIVVVEFGSLALVLDRFDGMMGWSLWEVAFLYGLVEISFGLMDLIFSGFDPQGFGRMVRQGLLDQLLLRPVNLIVQLFGSAFLLRRLGKVGMGVFILVRASAALEKIWSWGELLYLLLLVGSFVLFLGSLFMIGATISFWTIESLEAINIATYGTGFASSHPMHIFGKELRAFFTYLLPAIFFSYYPVLYLLDKTDPLIGVVPVQFLFVAPFTAIIFFVGSLYFWQFGLSYYQSSGS